MEDTVIKEVIKKSELAAKDAYEYQWITYPEYGFLQSHIEEKTEELPEGRGLGSHHKVSGFAKGSPFGGAGREAA